MFYGNSFHYLLGRATQKVENLAQSKLIEAYNTEDDMFSCNGYISHANLLFRSQQGLLIWSMIYQIKKLVESNFN